MRSSGGAWHSREPCGTPLQVPGGFRNKRAHDNDNTRLDRPHQSVDFGYGWARQWGVFPHHSTASSTRGQNHFTESD